MSDPGDSPYLERSGLLVGSELAAMLETEALPIAGVEPDRFWQGLSALIHDLAPRNAELLQIRADMQSAIDAWHKQRSGRPHDPAEYRSFLEELGYIVPPGPAFNIDTDHLDPEISSIPGPQLVVPVTNARYAINAANARWGSLYDALYGTDALGDLPAAGPYDPGRGARVIAWVRDFLDEIAPLGSEGSHHDAVAYRIVDGELIVGLADGSDSGLADASLLAGYIGDPSEPRSILLEHHGLGVEQPVDVLAV